MIAGLVLAWAIGGAQLASAHATLVGSSPAAGQVLETAPTEVRLWFSEDVNVLDRGIAVLDPAGQHIEESAARRGANNRTIRTGVLPVAAEGTYTVQWSVVSVDGHPLRGSFSFAVGQASADGLPPSTTQGARAWVTAFGGVARAGAYLGGLCLVGTLALAVALNRKSPAAAEVLQRYGVTAAFFLAVAAALVLLAEALAITAGEWSEVWSASTWAALREGRHLSSAGMVALGALLAGSAAHGRAAWRTAATLAACALVAGGFAASGHAAGAGEPGPWIAINAVHVLATGAWFGGLGGLVLIGVRGDGVAEDFSVVARRFSAVAQFAAPLAVLTGVLLALEIAPDPGDLADGWFGRLLLFKVAAVVVALVLAAWNRQVLLRRMAAMPGRATGLLRRFAACEAAALALAVVVSGWLVAQPPLGSAGSTPEAQPGLLADGRIGPYHALLAISPGTAGQNTVSVALHPLAAEGDALPDRVSVVVGSTPVELARSGADAYVGVATLAAGPTTVTVELTLPGGEGASAEFAVVIAP